MSGTMFINLRFNITSAPRIITLPIDTSGIVYNNLWGDGSTDSSNSHIYTSTGIYDASINIVSGSTTRFGNGTQWIGGGALTHVLDWSNSITSLESAFFNCVNLTTVPSSLPTSLTNLRETFRRALIFNQNISSWNTSNVVNMNRTFFDAQLFNQPIGTWNTSNVQNMENMFFYALAFNQPISSWNTGNVVFMGQMFQGSPFNQPIGTWNTGSVTQMGGMFSATVFNQPIGSWNTGNLIFMNGMFEDATAFNQPIGSWNTGNVVNMANVFTNATSFNQSIGSWDVRNVQNMIGMLSGSAIDITNYDNILQGWASQNVQNGISLGANGLSYDYNGVLGRTTLVNFYNWVIVGDSFVPCYLKGTKILCSRNDEDVYIPIEELEPGMLVKTYADGYKEIDVVLKGKLKNDPDCWHNCMYRLVSDNPEFDDLVVTGGHGVLKRELSKQEIHADYNWFTYNKRYSIIDKMHVQRAAFCKDFVKINDTNEYTYYHFSLKSRRKWKRYGVWANGVLSESTFKHDLLK